MKLFTKYNRINLMVMSVVFILSGVGYYLLINYVLKHELDEALGKYEVRVEKFVSQNDSLPIFKNFEEVEVDYKEVNQVTKQKYSSVNRYDPEEHEMGAYRQLVFTQKVNGKLYQIRVAKPIEGTRLLINGIAYSTLAILLIVILISVVVNRLILKKLWQPFYSTILEMKGFKLGNQAMPKLPETEIEEFSFMNSSLNEVIRSAKDDYRILKEFTENASHETQTPLSIIRSKLDLVIQEEGLSESQSDAMKSIYSGIHRLTKLNQSLLLLTKIENQQFEVTELINIKEKVNEKLLQFHELWEGSRIIVTSKLDESFITANVELIDVLLNNLLSNAGKHTSENGEIVILIQQGILKIANTTNGNELDTDKIFNRFYKENQHSQNNGLGLSIVKQICDRSGISIKYTYHDPYPYHCFTLSW